MTNDELNLTVLSNYYMFYYFADKSVEFPNVEQEKQVLKFLKERDYSEIGEYFEELAYEESIEDMILFDKGNNEDLLCERGTCIAQDNCDTEFEQYISIHCGWGGVMNE